MAAAESVETVRVEVPVGELGDSETLVGMKEVKTSGWRTVALRLTEPLKPKRLVRVILEELKEPRITTMLAGLLLGGLKSGGGVTATFTTVDSDMGTPLGPAPVPVTVTA